jgi:hypothetical protein
MLNGLKMTVSVEASSHPYAEEQVLSVSKVLVTVIIFLLYSFFWVVPRVLCADVSQTPGNNPKERIQYLEHGECLKSRIIKYFFKIFYDDPVW